VRIPYVDLTMQPVNFKPNPKTRLTDVAIISAGYGVSRELSVNTPVDSGDSLSTIGVRDLVEGTVNPIEKLDTVSHKNTERAKKAAVFSDDVLLAGRGTVMKFGLVGPETAGAIASSNIIIVRPKAQIIGAALYAILSSDVFRRKIELLQRGGNTMMVSLSPKDLANLEIEMPPANIQRMVADLMREAQVAYRTTIEAADIRRDLARKIADQCLFGSKI
jgi:Type I restriction modification DNA specificity domain